MFIITHQKGSKSLFFKKVVAKVFPFMHLFMGCIYIHPVCLMLILANGLMLASRVISILFCFWMSSVRRDNLQFITAINREEQNNIDDTFLSLRFGLNQFHTTGVSVIVTRRRDFKPRCPLLVSPLSAYQSIKPWRKVGEEFQKVVI